MGKIVTVTNQKGGAGKTTTAQALAGGLTLRGYRVLSVDLDGQCNLSYSAGASMKGGSIMGALMEDGPEPEIDIRAIIQHTADGGDIIPANTACSNADVLIEGPRSEYRLAKALAPLRADYDYIIIDTPPNLGILTINALAASHSVIIPAQADTYSLQGILALGDTLKVVKEYTNPGLHVEGILLTRYNPRAVLSRDIAETAAGIAGQLGTRLFKTAIREAIAVKEAQFYRRNLFSYAPKAKVTGDYMQFINELLREDQ